MHVARLTAPNGLLQIVRDADSIPRLDRRLLSEENDSRRLILYLLRTLCRKRRFKLDCACYCSQCRRCMAPRSSSPFLELLRAASSPLAIPFEQRLAAAPWLA